MEQERTLRRPAKLASLSPRAGREVLRQSEGEAAEHLDVLVLQRREPPEGLVGDHVAGDTQLGDRVVKAFSVPEHERVARETQRAEPVFLASAVGLAQLAFLPLHARARRAVRHGLEAPALLFARGREFIRVRVLVPATPSGVLGRHRYDCDAQGLGTQTHGSVGSHERDALLPVLLELAAGLEYLFVSVRWPVSRRGLDQHLDRCVGA